MKHGPGRWGAALERLAFSIFGFEPFTPQQFLQDGDVLPIWGGLRAVSLPGHTAGHTGFFSEERGILFCGDLFASFPGFSHLPPAVFNEDDKAIRESIVHALALNPAGLLPNHADNAPPSVHLRRLQSLARRLSISPVAKPVPPHPSS